MNPVMKNRSKLCLELFVSFINDISDLCALISLYKKFQVRILIKSHYQGGVFTPISKELNGKCKVSNAILG